MANNLFAHRDERELLSLDFTDELDTLETIDTVLDFVVVRDGVDVTTQFGETDPIAPAINGTLVQFWKREAVADDEQLRGLHQVFCRIETSEGRKLVGQTAKQRLPVLRVFIGGYTLADVTS